MEGYKLERLLSRFNDEYEVDTLPVRIMNMRSAPLGDIGAKAVAEFLVTNRSVKALVLSQCDITEIGAFALAKGLAANEGCLLDVDLSDNNISSRGLHAIISALRETKIRSLDLRKNHMNEEVLFSFSQEYFLPAGNRATLVCLRLWTGDNTSGKPFSDKAIAAFMRSLKHCTTLTTLQLVVAPLDEKDREELVKAVESNWSIVHLPYDRQPPPPFGKASRRKGGKKHTIDNPILETLNRNFGRMMNQVMFGEAVMPLVLGDLVIQYSGLLHRQPDFPNYDDEDYP